MPSSAPVLQVSTLTVRFGDLVVLRDLSFDVAPRTALAVIGPNGAGKTVLFRALIGAVPYEGDVRWAPGVRLGYVPQRLDLQRDMPVSGLEFLRARRSIGKPAGDVDRVLALVGLPAASARRAIGHLSGGQFQRLLMAFALLGDPTVLLLDEPTAGVDEPGQEHLHDVVHRLQVERGLTVLLISHDLSVVYRHATDVLCLGQGTASLGPPDEVLDGPSIRATYGTEMALHRHDH